MKHKKTIFKLGSTALALSIGFTALAPTSSAFAAEKNVNILAISNSKFVPNNFDRNVLYNLGISNLEISKLLNTSTTGITLENGVAYDTNGNILTVKERGKLSWAAKALRGAWNKVPSNVKAAMGGLAGFEVILGVIDRFTGTIEAACYQGALKVTGNETAAWWISKTLCLLI